MEKKEENKKMRKNLRIGQTKGRKIRKRIKEDE